MTHSRFKVKLLVQLRRQTLKQKIKANIKPMFFQCWASVYDAGPSLKRHWAMYLVWYACSGEIFLWVNPRQAQAMHF